MLYVDMHVMKDNMLLYVHKLCMLGLNINIISFSQ